MRKSELIIVFIIFISFAIAFWLYPQMPQMMVSHWDCQGRADGYMSKFWALFLMPIISLFMFFLFLLVPKIDPLKHNIEKFRKYFDAFIVISFLFLFYLYLLTILWNLGLRFDFVKFLVPAFSFLFFWCGILIEKAKRNWFLGIRTPWTLSSDKVWERTHKLGGKLFKILAIISFLGIIFPDFAIFFLIVPLLLITIYLFIYSYFQYQKENKA